MSIDIAIPKLGMTMTKAKIAEWKAAEGDRIKKDQGILVIETEKVTYEVEAQGEGLLHIIVPVGEEADVGQTVGQLAESEEELATLQAASPAAVTAQPVTTSSSKVSDSSLKTDQPDLPQGKIRITPRAKRKAEDHGIDYTIIHGSGPGGRIVEKDIENAIAATKDAPQRTIPQGFHEGQVLDGKRVKETIPLRGMRKAISDHMLRSLQVSAQLTAGSEVDMTEMIRFRNIQKKAERFKETQLSFTEIFVYIIAKVLKEQPIMNSSLINDQIQIWEDINIGVAVAIKMGENENGLAVPVIRNADRLSLYQITQDVRRLVTKAKQGKLELDDMTMGTFTLTNTGTFGSRWSWSTPILNQPEVGILQTGAIVDRFVPVNGEAAIKPMMPLILTFDHRVVDGSGASRFAFRIAELMENPYQLVE